MKQFIILLVLLTEGFWADAQSSLVRLVLRGESNAQPWGIVASYDGGYIISGCANSYSGATKQDLLIAKFNHNFQLIWRKVLSTAKNENARFLMETGTRDIVVAYETCDSMPVPNGNFEAMHMLKLDGAGNMRWVKSFYQNKYCGSSTVKGIFETTGGNYALFHDPSTLTFGEPVGMLITDTAGNIISDKQIRNPSSIDFPVIRKYGSNFLILGTDDIISINKNSMMYVFCDAFGTVRHSGRYGNGEDFTSEDISAMPDGNLLLLNGASSTPCMTKIDTNGNKLWSKKYSSTGDTVFTNAIIANNKMFLAGYCYIGGHANINENIITAEIDTAGNFIWAKLTPIQVGPFKAIYDATENALVLTGYYYLAPYPALLARIGMSSALQCGEQAITVHSSAYGIIANITGTVNDTLSTFTVPAPVFTTLGAATAGDSTLCGVPSAIKQPSPAAAFAIYPNPARAGNQLRVAISHPGTSAKLQLFDIAGRLVYCKELYNAMNIIAAPGLQGGLYMARFMQGNDVTVMKLVIMD